MTTLRVCEHQVGGHMTKESKPDTLVDDSGSFYKPYQAGDRNVREAAFYGLLWGKLTPKPATLQSSVAAPSNAPPPEEYQASTTPEIEVWGASEAFLGKTGTAKEEDIAGLRAFIPMSHGVAVVEDRQYLVLEDVCAQYKKPCVLDLKIGFSTQYAWAPEAYREKCKGKDESTTQSTLGFRLSGLQVYDRSGGLMHKSERQWGKTLTAETMPDALIKFSGELDHIELYRSSQSSFLSQLESIQRWFSAQTSFCFYQASLLFTWEGEAETVDKANTQIHLIDFAHTFPTNGERDENFLAGLDSLIAMIKALK